MGIVEITVIIATFLCSLVAGFLFAFAVVIMPGINTLDDKAFIRAFQVMDGVIQNNQPLFIFVWVGSALAVIAALIVGVWPLDWAGRILLLIAGGVYLLGVQLPTIRINIPLNNALQALDVEAMSEAELRAAREAFEPTWNRWNTIRTGLSCLVTLLLIILVSSISQ